MEPFDFLASYHLKSDFLFSYYSPYVYEVANRPLPDDFMKRKTTRAPILWIAKNCYATSGRQTYVAELMKYIRVDSYGPCLNNIEFTENLTRTDLMTEYKFYLAIENANCDDYVTEKLFDTLVLSTVPIVDGPDSYEAFLPNSKAAIRMDDYPDPRKLAAYIDYLDKNDTAYLEHLSHQRDAKTLSAKKRLSPAFIGNWSDPDLHRKRSDWCSVCRGVAPIWRGRVEPYYTHVPPIERKDRFLIDRSCKKPGKWDYASDGPPYNAPWAQISLEDADSSLAHGNHTFGESVEDQMWSVLSIWKLELVICALFLAFIISMLYKRRIFTFLQNRSPQPN
ncbi:hypothetical protein CLU79DRAFT_726032 [Phycomyces nitens]|nr:hypothetical protein CLU79DRAFT_726032 [Phycomyces nitens]